MEYSGELLDVYTGTFEQLIDAKQRIILPRAFRQAFGGFFTISLGFDGCLCLWRTEDWQAFVDREVSARSQLSRDARDVNRWLLNNAFSGEFDSQFRFMIPQALRDKVVLGRQVILAGTGNRLEIWAKESWQAYQTRIAGNIDQIADSLAREFRV